MVSYFYYNPRDLYINKKSLRQISRDNYSFVNLCAYHYWRCLFIHDAIFKEQLQKKVQKGGQKSLQVFNCVATQHCVSSHWLNQVNWQIWNFSRMDSSLQEMGMLACASNLVFWRFSWRQENQELKFIPGYTVSLGQPRLDWDPVSKQQNKNKTKKMDAVFQHLKLPVIISFIVMNQIAWNDVNKFINNYN